MMKKNVTARGIRINALDKKLSFFPSPFVLPLDLQK
jgi:hypothetical protein